MPNKVHVNLPLVCVTVSEVSLCGLDVDFSWGIGELNALCPGPLV